MLSPATLTVADRLASILMALVDPTCAIAHAGGTEAFPGHAAHTLFLRLARLIAGLIQICNLGIRPRRQAAEAPTRAAPAAAPQGRSPARTLPRRLGWLLAALPGIAPAIAADLAALLADPALAPLLAAAPTLHRALRPILRGLGLDRPPRTPGSAPPHRHPDPKAPHRHPGPAAAAASPTARVETA